MIRLLLAAPASGSGKTAVTCALLSALKKRGLDPCAFKCGPDYIDPMFHRSVLGVESHNLDLFLAEETAVRENFRRWTAGHGAAVCEGAMGFYDGLGGTTDRASAWHVAKTLELPVLLVVRPRGASLTLAAQIRGLLDFRRDSGVIGILLNDCAPSLCRSLAPMLERETGLPVLGCLPHLEEAAFSSRHLGLYTAGEIHDLTRRIDLLAQGLEKHADLDRLLVLCQGGEPVLPGAIPAGNGSVPIAVARDEAFCFTYAETLETLEAAGGCLRFFSPLRDSALPPDAAGLYLPGGYPELYAEALSRNEAMRRAVARAVEAGLPTVAECGGFLYLGQALEDEKGRGFPMAGALPGQGVRTPRLVRFGYGELTAGTDSLLLRAGETLPVHEFHYWDCTQNGDAFQMRKPLTGRSWACGFASDTLYAAFPHIYFAGRPKLAERFVAAASAYLNRRIFSCETC